MDSYENREDLKPYSYIGHANGTLSIVQMYIDLQTKFLADPQVSDQCKLDMVKWYAEQIDGALKRNEAHRTRLVPQLS